MDNFMKEYINNKENRGYYVPFEEQEIIKSYHIALLTEIRRQIAEKRAKWKDDAPFSYKTACDNILQILKED